MKTLPEKYQLIFGLHAFKQLFNDIHFSLTLILWGFKGHFSSVGENLNQRQLSNLSTFFKVFLTLRPPFLNKFVLFRNTFTYLC